MANNTNRVIDETIGAFKKLKEEVKQYKDELATLTAGTDKWRETAEKLRNAQKQVDAINKAAKGTLTAYNKEQVNSINELKERIKLLNQERNAMDMNSKEYKEATAELKELNDKLREAGTSAGDWKANVGNYANSIKDAFGELGGAANGLVGSFGNLNAGMLKLASNPLGAAVLALVGAIKFLAEGIKSSEENTKKWNEAMIPLKTVIVMIQNAAQDAAARFTDWVASLRQSETAANILKGVLTALLTVFNYIVDKVKSIGENIKGAMTEFKHHIEQLKTWANQLKETLKPVTDFVGNIYDSIKEKLEPVIDWIIDKYNWLANSKLGDLLHLDEIKKIESAFSKAKQQVSGLEKTYKETEEVVTDYTNKANNLGKVLDGLITKQAKLENEVEQANQAYREAIEAKDYEAAQDALIKKQEKEIELAKTKKAVAAANLAVLEAEAKLSGNSAEQNRAIAQARAEVIRADGELARVAAQAAKEQDALNKKIEAQAKEMKNNAFKQSVAELTRELNDFAASYNNIINTLKEPVKPEVFTPDNIDSYYDTLIANAQTEYDAYVELINKKIEALEAFVEKEKALGNDVAQYETQLIALRREAEDGYVKEQAKLDKAVEKSNKDRLKATKAFNKAQLSSYADLFDGISGMFEQESIAYKATATAKAIIATYLAATESFANAGGAPWGFVPMAASIAAGLAQVKQIWSTDPKGENSVPSGNISTPTIAEPAVQESNPYTYTRTVQTFEEEDNLNRPMFVSVVDINNVQNRVKVTEEESSW